LPAAQRIGQENFDIAVDVVRSVTFVGDNQVRAPVAVDVLRDDRCRVQPESIQNRAERERAVAVAVFDGNRVVAVIGDGEILVVIAVEVARRNADGFASLRQ
jgi:hypothetical protein